MTDIHICVAGRHFDIDPTDDNQAQEMFSAAMFYVRLLETDAMRADEMTVKELAKEAQAMKGTNA